MGSTLEFSSDGLLNYVVPNIKEAILQLEQAKAKLQNIDLVSEIPATVTLKGYGNSEISKMILDLELIKTFITNKVDAFEQAQQNSDLKFKKVDIKTAKDSKLLVFAAGGYGNTNDWQQQANKAAGLGLHPETKVNNSTASEEERKGKEKLKKEEERKEAEQKLEKALKNAEKQSKEINAGMNEANKEASAKNAAQQTGKDYEDIKADMKKAEEHREQIVDEMAENAANKNGASGQYKEKWKEEYKENLTYDKVYDYEKKKKEAATKEKAVQDSSAKHTTVDVELLDSNQEKKPVTKSTPQSKSDEKGTEGGSPIVNTGGGDSAKKVPFANTGRGDSAKKVPFANTGGGDTSKRVPSKSDDTAKEKGTTKKENNGDGKGKKSTSTNETTEPTFSQFMNYLKDNISNLDIVNLDIVWDTDIVYKTNEYGDVLWEPDTNDLQIDKEKTKEHKISYAELHAMEQELKKYGIDITKVSYSDAVNVLKEHGWNPKIIDKMTEIENDNTEKISVTRIKNVGDRANAAGDATYFGELQKKDVISGSENQEIIEKIWDDYHSNIRTWTVNEVIEDLEKRGKYKDAEDLKKVLRRASKNGKIGDNAQIRDGLEDHSGGSATTANVDLYLQNHGIEGDSKVNLDALSDKNKEYVERKLNEVGFDINGDIDISEAVKELSLEKEYEAISQLISGTKKLENQKEDKKADKKEDTNKGKTGGKTGENTGGKTGENTGGKTGGKTGENTGGKTGENTGGKTGENTGGKTGGKTGGNTGGKTGENTGGKTGENTGGKTGGKTGGNTGGKTGGKTGGNTGGNTTGYDGSPYNQVTDKLIKDKVDKLNNEIQSTVEIPELSKLALTVTEEDIKAILANVPDQYKLQAFNDLNLDRFVKDKLLNDYREETEKQIQSGKKDTKANTFSDVVRTPQDSFGELDYTSDLVHINEKSGNTYLLYRQGSKEEEVSKSWGDSEINGICTAGAVTTAESGYDDDVKLEKTGDKMLDISKNNDDYYKLRSKGNVFETLVEDGYTVKGYTINDATDTDKKKIIEHLEGGDAIVFGLKGDLELFGDNGYKSQRVNLEHEIAILDIKKEADGTYKVYINDSSGMDGWADLNKLIDDSNNTGSYYLLISKDGTPSESQFYDVNVYDSNIDKMSSENVVKDEQGNLRYQVTDGNKNKKLEYVDSNHNIVNKNITDQSYDKFINESVKEEDKAFFDKVIDTLGKNNIQIADTDNMGVVIKKYAELIEKDPNRSEVLYEEIDKVLINNYLTIKDYEELKGNLKLGENGLEQQKKDLWQDIPLRDLYGPDILSTTQDNIVGVSGLEGEEAKEFEKYLSDNLLDEDIYKFEKARENNNSKGMEEVVSDLYNEWKGNKSTDSETNPDYIKRYE